VISVISGLLFMNNLISKYFTACASRQTSSTSKS